MLTKETFAVILLGFISGILGAGTDYLHKNALYSFLPGTIYGIALGMYYLYKKKTSLLKTFFFIFCSSLAYFIAVWITIILVVLLITSSAQSSGVLRYINPICLIIGGLIGTLILVGGIRLFLEKISFLKMAIIIVAGGVLGLSYNLVPMRSGMLEITYQNALILYVCWQVGVNLLLHFLPNKNLK